MKWTLILNLLYFEVIGHVVLIWKFSIGKKRNEKTIYSLESTFKHTLMEKYSL